MTSITLIPSRSYNRALNLPNVNSDSPEARFLAEFEKVFFNQTCGPCVYCREFEMDGYGVADLVYLPISAQPEHFGRKKLIAFEGKLLAWRTALGQAFRYRYFADKSIVLLPFLTSRSAIENISHFKRMQVGLWTFESEALRIRQHFTPTKIHAFNIRARAKAIAELSV